MNPCRRRCLKTAAFLLGLTFMLSGLTLAAEMPVVFARNRLCALAAPGVEVTTETLLDRMPEPGVKLGTSTPKADPSGDYAWQVFARILVLPESLAVGASYALTVVKPVRLGAARFALFVVSTQGQEILALHGFTPVATP